MLEYESIYKFLITFIIPVSMNFTVKHNIFIISAYIVSVAMNLISITD